jgi:glutathione peroxidase
MTSLYDFSVKTIDGRDTTLAEYRGRVLLIVNVACRCGFTRQYAGLEQLYRTYKSIGLTVLGFPCNQFAGQEPGDEAEIKQFCSLKYDVTFPLFAKIDVNGDNAHPLYRYLKAEKKGFFWTSRIKWNFTKFLVSRTGRVVRRFAPVTGAHRIERAIAPLLADTGA